MKKFVAVMIFAFVAAFSVSICSAYDYDSDPNYKFVTTQMGMWYLYLPSVDVQEYNPPHYQITGDMVHVEGTYNKETWRSMTIRYNWYTKETYHRNDSGNWEKDYVNGDSMASTRARRFADALFRAAYNMDFYGY